MLYDLFVLQRKMQHLFVLGGQSSFMFFSTLNKRREKADFMYSWTREPNRLHHTSCRQPCGLNALGLQRGIPYEISRDRRSEVDRITSEPLPTSRKSIS
jgi:hypothetical protein